MHSSLDALRLCASAGLSTLARGRLLNCVWELTYRCNARCAICAYWQHPSDSRRELTLADVCAGLQKIHAYGCRFVNFTGGEPTLRDDLEPIVARASDLRMWTSVVTNGSTLTRDRVAALRRAGLDNLFISLDSAGAAAHDAQRGVPGLHARVLRALDWLRDEFIAGHRTAGVMCVISKANADDIEHVAELARAHGVYVVFQPYHDRKRGDTRFTAATAAAVFARMGPLRRTNRRVLSSTRYLGGFARFAARDSLPRCHAGLKYFSVDPFGFLHPCVDLPAVGRVLVDDISVVRDARAAAHVAACEGCWYCFRGEADASLTPGGYAEKIRMAASVLRQNAATRNGTGRAAEDRSKRPCPSAVRSP